MTVFQGAAGLRMRASLPRWHRSVAQVVLLTAIELVALTGCRYGPLHARAHQTAQDRLTPRWAGGRKAGNGRAPAAWPLALPSGLQGRLLLQQLVLRRLLLVHVQLHVARQVAPIDLAAYTVGSVCGRTQAEARSRTQTVTGGPGARCCRCNGCRLTVGQRIARTMWALQGKGFRHRLQHVVIGLP